MLPALHLRLLIQLLSHHLFRTHTRAPCAGGFKAYQRGASASAISAAAAPSNAWSGTDAALPPVETSAPLYFQVRATVTWCPCPQLLQSCQGNATRSEGRMFIATWSTLWFGWAMPPHLVVLDLAPLSPPALAPPPSQTLQVGVLALRNFRTWLRNPTMLVSELIQYVFLSLLIGAMYHKWVVCVGGGGMGAIQFRGVAVAQQPLRPGPQGKDIQWIVFTLWPVAWTVQAVSSSRLVDAAWMVEGRSEKLWRGASAGGSSSLSKRRRESGTKQCLFTGTAAVLQGSRCGVDGTSCAGTAQRACTCRTGIHQLTCFRT